MSRGQINRLSLQAPKASRSPRHHPATGSVFDNESRMAEHKKKKKKKKLLSRAKFLRCSCSVPQGLMRKSEFTLV
jgi:hypothetical protein